MERKALFSVQQQFEDTKERLQKWSERPRGSVSCFLPGSCSVLPVMTLYCSDVRREELGGGWIVTSCVRLELCCDLSLLCTPCTTITALCCDPVTERHYCHADEVISFTGIKTKLHNRYKKVFLLTLKCYEHS